MVIKEKEGRWQTKNAQEEADSRAGTVLQRSTECRMLVMTNEGEMNRREYNHINRSDTLATISTVLHESMRRTLDVSNVRKER